MSAAGLLLAGGAAIGAAGTASAAPASTHQSVVTGGFGCNSRFGGGFNNCRGYGGFGYGGYGYAPVAVVPVVVVPTVGYGGFGGFGGYGGFGGFGGFGF